MPRSGPRALRKYSDEFKLPAVRLSQQRGIQVKTVAARSRVVQVYPGQPDYEWRSTSS